MMNNPINKTRLNAAAAVGTIFLLKTNKPFGIRINLMNQTLGAFMTFRISCMQLKHFYCLLSA